MKDFKFGKLSRQRLATCHPYLIKIMERALEISPVDFGISEGHRSRERQNELYLQGKSRIDGINRRGKHNFTPSEAVDIYAYHGEYKLRKQIAYDKVHLSVLAGVIFAAANELNEKGEINCTLRWGANWDGDGVIAIDQSFDDFPHFEIININ